MSRTSRIGWVSRTVAAWSVTLLLGGVARGAESFSGRVVSVRDGDTLEVMREGRAEPLAAVGSMAAGLGALCFAARVLRTDLRGE